MQAALFASSQRTLSIAPFKAGTSTATESTSFIPTPDATGLVAEYDDLYPSKRYKDPVTHLRYSDSIDESCVGGLAGSFTYFCDERDAEWLANRNGAAKGEGTRISGNETISCETQTATVVPPHRILHARSSNSKGKEPEHPLLSDQSPSDVVINEDHFELIMGLFEKWTDESVSPYLHLVRLLAQCLRRFSSFMQDLQPDHFPNFDNYQSYFTDSLSPSLFANFAIPADIPNPEKMVQLAGAIYPWWRERRMNRNGQRIVPQLHVCISLIFNHHHSECAYSGFDS